MMDAITLSRPFAVPVCGSWDGGRRTPVTFPPCRLRDSGMNVPDVLRDRGWDFHKNKGDKSVCASRMLKIQDKCTQTRPLYANWYEYCTDIR